MNSICKRSFDFVLALAGMIIALPLMATISLLLWIESPGNVFFAQERLGWNGKRFKLYKFRKFPADMGTGGTGVTVSGDARLTPLGRILERTKLDELPQLWNIIKGEMSFVGPRPETLRFAELFQGEFAEILQFKPGIFGPNQIKYRNEAEMYPPSESPEEYYKEVLFPDKAKNDLVYFRHANCFSDIKWIIQGIWVSLIGAINWKRLAGLHLRIIAIDAAMVAIAWFIAWGFRYSINPLSVQFSVLTTGLWLSPLLMIGILAVGGCYQHPVRSFSISDALRLCVTATVGWLFFFLVLIGFVERGVSILLAPLGWLCVIPLLILPRVGRRLMWERFLGERDHSDDCRLLIYGAGRFGTALANWLKTNSAGIHFIGFLDDASELRHRRMNGYRVLGRGVDIPTVHERYDIDEIWVSFLPSRSVRERLQFVCDKLQIRMVMIPEQEPFQRFKEVPSNLRNTSASFQHSQKKAA